MIINSYFPTDPKTLNNDNRDLVTTLAILINIIEATPFHSLYLAGDINADFLRNSSHVQEVRNFMSRLNLFSLWDIYDVDFTHTFERATGEVYHNTIDHILTLSRSQSTIEDAGVIHSIENMSDHEPIYAIIKVEHAIESDDADEPIGKPRPVWRNATEDQKLEYNDVLFRRLLRMEIPESVRLCSDVHCKDENHKKDIDKYVEDILTNVSESGHETLPIVAPKKKIHQKKTPGWKEYVQPFQDQAHFWNSVWKSADKPLNTELHRIMKHTRNLFHYQVRKCRRVEDYLRNRKIIENCVENDTDLFAEIKKQRKNDNEEDVTIDGAAGSNIPNKFGEIYRELF